MTDQKARGPDNFITTDQTTSRLKLSILSVFIFNTIFTITFSSCFRYDVSPQRLRHVFSTTFLHNILVMIILQITFVHTYNLNDDIHLCLTQIPDQSR
jgi:hypothetical protein